MAFKRGTMVDLCLAYMLMHVLMTLTLIQGYSGLAEEYNIKAMTFKVYITVDLCMTYAHVHLDDLDLVLDFENVCKACRCFCLSVNLRHGTGLQQRVCLPFMHISFIFDV